MDAELRFEFEGARGATGYRVLRQDPPWKVVRGFLSGEGECLVHLNNVSGGVFGGDTLRLTGALHAGVEAQITTTGATRLYRPRATAAETVLRSEFRLAEGSLLEYLPDALIPYRGVRAIQHTSFSLQPGATLFAWDTVAPGRVAHGERFRYERLRLITEIDVTGMPILLDRLLLEPERWPIATPGRFGTAAGYLVTFVAVQAGASAATLRSLEDSLHQLLAQHSSPADGDLWGASILPAHGVMVRGAVRSSLQLPEVLHTIWSHCKRALLGRTAIALRKTY